MSVPRHSLFAMLAAGAALLASAAASPIAASRTLPNGIELPEAWPPVRTLDREPPPVPYLAAPPAVIPIDLGRQLFVDDFLVADTTLRRAWHHPEPYAGNPVLRPDRAWESAGTPGALAMPFSDGVWYDPAAGCFKMWYLAAAPAGTVPGQAEPRYMTAYATSRDGLHWEKPSLDVVPGTNLVSPEPRDSAVVWLDRNAADPARRYVLLRVHRGAGGKGWAMSIHYSADGIHWADAAATRTVSWFGDRSTAFFNPFRGVWVFSTRNTIRHDPEFAGVRVRFYHEAPDLAAGLATWERHPWVGADRLDLRHPRFPDFAPQLYNLDAVAYENVLLGLFSILQGPENDVSAKLNIHKRNQVLTGFSRDGYHWDRPDRTPFLGVDETDGAWNWGNVQSAGGGCVVVVDRLYFYYSGRQWSSAGGRGPGATGVAFLRRDGFASMDAGAAGGTLTTRPVRFSGRELFVNADVPAGGELRVAVLDEAGRALPGFEAERCVPLQADGTRLRVRWESGTDLGALVGKPVRFRFQLISGRLYAFWVSRDAGGASGGYVAAGGSEFAGDRDLPPGGR